MGSDYTVSDISVKLTSESEEETKVTASVALKENPTDAVTLGADITDGATTYEVLAFEQYGVANEGGANIVYTVDENNLIDGSDLTGKSTTAGSSSFGIKGYAITGGTDSTVKDGSCYYLSTGNVEISLTNKVAQIRIYVGAWYGQSGTFALKADGKTLSTYAYSNEDKQSDVIVFTVDTSALTDSETLNCVLEFVNTSANDGTLPCAGIQVLGVKGETNS